MLVAICWIVRYSGDRLQTEGAWIALVFGIGLVPSQRVQPIQPVVTEWGRAKPPLHIRALALCIGSGGRTPAGHSSGHNHKHPAATGGTSAQYSVQIGRWRPTGARTPVTLPKDRRGVLHG